MRYSRNRIYISKLYQQKIKSTRILVAGCGIGSVIAECALRLGFENIILVDGDSVEVSNLNRQNYLSSDIGNRKCDSIKSRLLNINPLAKINVLSYYLDKNNINHLINDCDIAINALDFNDNTPLVFDKICQLNNIPVLHPYNIGWAGLIYVIMPDGQGLDIISNDYIGFEKKVVSFFLRNLPSGSPHKEWISGVLDTYEKEKGYISPPQLSVGSWLLAGSCTEIMFRLATARTVKRFPLFYFTCTE